MKSDGRGELEQARTRYPGLGRLCRWHLPAETGSPPLNPRQAQPGEEAWSDTAWHEALAPILSLLSPPLLNPPTAPLSALLPTPAPPGMHFWQLSPCPQPQAPGTHVPQRPCTPPETHIPPQGPRQASGRRRAGNTGYSEAPYELPCCGARVTM